MKILKIFIVTFIITFLFMFMLDIPTVKKYIKDEAIYAINLCGGPTDMDGKISEKELQNSSHGRLGGIYYCFNSQFRTNSYMNGTLDLRFIVESTGTINQCGVSSTTLSQQIGNCVCRMIRRWNLPEKDESTTVEYKVIAQPMLIE